MCMFIKHHISKQSDSNVLTYDVRYYRQLEIVGFKSSFETADGRDVRENSWPRQRSDLLVNDLSRSRYRGADAGAGVRRAVSWDAEAGADV